jgi:tetratricopeptide (TPR) repeat protein
LYNTALARKYYRDAGSCYHKVGYSYGIANSYDAMANLFLDEGQLDSALVYNQKAAVLFENLQSYINLASSWLDIGTIHLQRNELAEAENYYLKGLKIKEESGDSISLAQALSLVSSLYLEKANQSVVNSLVYKKNLATAEEYALNSYKLATSGKNYPAIIEASGRLMTVYEKSGQPAESLRYAKIKLAIADSLGRMQRADALADAEARWENEQKQQEINQLHRERVLQQLLLSQTLRSKARLRILIGALLIVAVLMIILFFMFLKNRKRKKEIEYQQHLNEVTRLKMQNIKHRLSPHLLFNLLGSVTHAENQAGRETGNRLTKIAHLLRKSLESTEKVAITLNEELEMVSTYLDLQSSRIDGGIRFDLLVDERVPRDVLIPAMAIQIPVENAIKHGLLPLEGDRNLTIRCLISGVQLNIEIEDNGVGRSQSAGRTSGTGTGLKSLLQTIHLLNRRNKEPIVFAIDDVASGGTLVRITVPITFDYTL